MTIERRIPDLIAVLAGVAVMAAFVVFLMHAENELNMLLAFVVAVGGGLIARRTGWFARASHGMATWSTASNLSIGLAFLAVIVVLRDEHFSLLLLSTIMLYSIVCLGLNLQTGLCGVMNFAAAAFFGTGAYTAAVLSVHTAMPHALVILAGGLMAALLGSMLLLPVLRTRGHYAALVTIAFGTMFRSFLEVNDTLGGPQGILMPSMNLFGWDLGQDLTLFGLTFSFYANYAVLIFGLLVVFFVVSRRIERSWIGVSFDTVRIDEVAAATFGINIARWKITVFIIGNLFAGIAGACFGMMTGFVAPTSFTFADSLILLSIIVLGGMGNQWAVFPAAIIVLLLPEKLQAIQEYRFLLYGVAVILILLFRPDGLFRRPLRTLVVKGGAK